MSTRCSGISKEGFENEEDMCKLSNSKPTEKNTYRARKVIKEFAKTPRGRPKSCDPGVLKVRHEYSIFYCSTVISEVLSDDTMG